MSVADAESASSDVKPQRKLSLADINAVAKLVSTRCLTETEACHNLEIEPVRWFRFKETGKTKPKYETALARMRAAKIESCIARIDDCGDGIGMKQPDWRAKAWLLQVTDRKRFGNESTAVERDTIINVAVLSDTLKRIYDVEPKLICDKPKIKLPIRQQASVV